MSTPDVVKQRNYFVVKSNDIIQRSRFSMSVRQQKIMLFLISKIRPLDDSRQTYTFNVREYCKVCNIDPSNGRTYIELKDSLKNVADKSIWVKDYTGREILLRWLDKVRIDCYSGTIEIKFHDDMFPYLLDLHERYTQYSLANILPMKSKYGIRLYELLKSYEKLEEYITIPLEELKKRMDCENYKRFPDFRRFALEPALQDIENCGDIEVEYRLCKNGGRSYDTVVFSICPADELAMNDKILYRELSLESDKKAMKALDKGGVKGYLEYKREH